MDYLWSPWRYRYVTGADPQVGCVFCRKLDENKDEENFMDKARVVMFLVEEHHSDI